MDINAILDKPVFSKMPAEQLAAFRQLLSDLQGKTLPEAMPVMMRFMAEAPKGEPLPAEDQEALTQAVLESLSESERVKFKAMMAVARGKG